MQEKPRKSITKVLLLPQVYQKWYWSLLVFQSVGKLYEVEHLLPFSLGLLRSNTKKRHSS
jgi:hypothetical protein